MVSPLLAAKLGTDVVGAAGNFILADTQVKMQKDAQKHREAMLGISSALQLNSVTKQEIDVRDSSIRLQQQISIASMQDKGQAEVNAAAAGVAGSSVDQVMRGLERSALNANYARMKSLKSNMQAAGDQRKNITLNRIAGRDTRVFQSPNVGMALLGLGTSLVSTYNNNQPEGDGLGNSLSRLLGGKG